MLRIHTRQNRLSQILRLIAGSSLVVLAALSITAALGLLIVRINGEQLLSVQTGSMQPTFRPGDAVLVQPTTARELHAGEIISYQSLHDPGLIISHRLTQVDQTTGWLTTKGDALKTADPTFPPRLVVGRVTAFVPRFGLVLNSLRQPLGLIVVIYLPALIIVASEVKRALWRYGHVHYRLTT